jgi:hypothetical protein
MAVLLDLNGLEQIINPHMSFREWEIFHNHKEHPSSDLRP